MKKFDQAKTSEGEDGVDKISNLPDHILQLIISRIPSTEEVIRTSILSKRWRNLWTLVPFIDIDYIRGWDESDSKGFKEFVDWVLLNKPQDSESIRLWCANYHNMSTIRQWIDATVVRKVKLLDLMFSSIDESETIELPQCLVTCDTLEVLKLFLMGSTLTLHKLTGFVALRVLELTNVELDQGDLVKYFLKSCPLLEDLSLIDCNAYSLDISSPKLKNLIIDSQEKITYKEYINGEKVAHGEYINDDSSTDTDTHWQMCLSLEISCPKALQFLKLNGYVATEVLFDSLYSLKKVVIYAQDLFESVETVYDLFDELSHVESLSISLYCVQQMTYMIEDPISLPNLKTLEVTVDALHALIPFLTCLPDLEYLHLIFPKYVYGLDKWNLEEAETINILTCHLKKVEFLEFDEKPNLAVARALLEHGNELEEMVFRWNNEDRFHEGSMETMNEVSKFHQASLNVKLRYVIKPHVEYSRPE